MNITVIGAAGRLGTQVCEQAQNRGHTVTGLARRPSRSRPRADVLVTGDARDPDAVRRAVTGADAVVVALSGGDRADPHRVRDATRTVVTAMDATAAPRVLVTSAYPIVARRPALVMTLLRGLFAVPYADAAAAERIVQDSTLDWTVIRLNRLVDGVPQGHPVVASGQLDRATGLSRTDAAALLLDLAESGTWSRAAINVRGRDTRDARRT